MQHTIIAPTFIKQIARVLVITTLIPTALATLARLCVSLRLLRSRRFLDSSFHQLVALELERIAVLSGDVSITQLDHDAATSAASSSSS